MQWHQMHFPLFQGEKTKANFWIHERLRQYSAPAQSSCHERAQSNMKLEVEQKMLLIHSFSAIERSRGCLRVFFPITNQRVLYFYFLKSHRDNCTAT